MGRCLPIVRIFTVLDGAASLLAIFDHSIGSGLTPMLSDGRDAHGRAQLTCWFTGVRVTSAIQRSSID